MADWTTADLMDGDDTLGSCDTQLRIFGKRRRMAGEIATLSCFEDFVLLRDTLATPGRGRVLVVDGRGSLHRALLGDRMAAAALRNGWAGVVVNGAIRDVGTLGDIDLCIKALGSNPRRGRQLGEGSAGEPVAFGGTVFRPGAYLYSDEDGIVVSADHP